MHAALEGVRVIDFTTLLPGPLATLMMAECGADVIKIERPGSGDEMRHYGPWVDGQSAPFMMLNRGKRSLSLDLKDPQGRSEVLELIQHADVLMEQFRPGVMASLGLGYDTIKAIKPDIIYCSITGYGQDSVHARTAGHDLNYAAEVGLLRLNVGEDEKPVLPHVPIADIAAGSYPAIINILLALRRRDAGLGGLHIDVSMAHGLAPLMYGAMAKLESLSPDTGLLQGKKQFLTDGERVFAGGSPRYQIYQTLDEEYIAVAAVEDRFWNRFCRLTGIDPASDMATVAAHIAQRTAEDWEALLENEDVCCTRVRSVKDYRASPLFVSTGRTVGLAGVRVNELPLPLAPEVRTAAADRAAPVASLGDTKVTWRAK